MTTKKIKQFTVISLLVASIILFLLSFRILMKRALDRETQNFINETTQYYSDLLYSQIMNDLHRTEDLAEYLDELDNYGITPENAVRKMKNNKYGDNFLLAGFIRPTEKGSFVYKDYSGDFEITEEQRALFSKLMKSGSSVFMAQIPGDSEYLADDLKNVSVFLYSAPCYYPNGLLKGVAFSISSADLYHESFSPSASDKDINVFFILDKNNVMVPAKIEREYGSFSKVKDALIRDDVRNKKVFEDLNANVDAHKDGKFTLLFNKKKLYCVYRPLKDTQYFIGLAINDNAITHGGANLLRTGQEVLFAIGILSIVLVILLILSNHSEKEGLRHLAYHDAITGHRNFSSFTQDFRNVLAKGKDTNYALIHFDIDKFKVFNEHYGYKVGNHLLSYISNTLKHALRDNEIFSRLNGDYFVILMHYENEDELLLRLKEIKNDIIDYKNKLNYRYDIMVRMGICKIDKESINVILNEKSHNANIISYVNLLIDKAGLARQSIKNMPLQTFYSFYQESMIEKILREKEIESEMQTALNHGDFVFYLQPKYSLETRSIAGAEALVRWLHPGKGLIPPDLFIPLFEKNGFVTEIDFYILEQVCKTLRKWIDEGYSVVPVSVNLSRQHLQRKETLSRISDVVNKYKIPVDLLEFELTESAMFEKMVFLADFGQKLRKNGFSISIDDFGSGYSSLNMLKDVEVDVLKLDKAFFENENQERGNQVISKFIELSKSLHMKVVSEGVETQEQVDFLTEVGCDMVQGYYFARPMPAEEFEEKYLKNQNVNDNEKA